MAARQKTQKIHKLAEEIVGGRRGSAQLCGFKVIIKPQTGYCEQAAGKRYQEAAHSIEVEHTAR